MQLKSTPSLRKRDEKKEGECVAEKFWFITARAVCCFKLGSLENTSALKVFSVIDYYNYLINLVLINSSNLKNVFKLWTIMFRFQQNAPIFKLKELACHEMCLF